MTKKKQFKIKDFTEIERLELTKNLFSAVKMQVQNTGLQRVDEALRDVQNFAFSADDVLTINYTFTFGGRDILAAANKDEMDFSKCSMKLN